MEVMMKSCEDLSLHVRNLKTCEFNSIRVSQGSVINAMNRVITKAGPFTSDHYINSDRVVHFSRMVIQDDATMNRSAVVLVGEVTESERVVSGFVISEQGEILFITQSRSPIRQDELVITTLRLYVALSQIQFFINGQYVPSNAPGNVKSAEIKKPEQNEVLAEFFQSFLM